MGPIYKRDVISDGKIGSVKGILPLDYLPTHE